MRCVILLVDVKTRMTPDITVRSIVRPMYQENRAFNGKMVVSGRYQRLWPTSNADHTAEESGQRLGNITEKMPGWNTSTVQSEQDVMNEATNQQHKTLHHTDGPLSSETCRIDGTPKNRGENNPWMRH